MALVEVLVAIVVLAVAGTALITMLGQTAHTVRTMRESDRRTRAASEQLERLVVWDAAQLRGQVGRSTFRGWTLYVTEVSRELFDVAIAENDTSAVLLRTTLYRPEVSDES
jgi:Tfp pilus assembly protein PilV